VGRLGEQGFRGFYSLVALATFVPLVATFFTHRAGRGIWLPALALTPGVWWVTMLVNFCAVLLIVLGFARPNPVSTLRASPDTEARGVLRITRHPGFMGFALLGLGHLFVLRAPVDLAFFGGLFAYSLLGAAHQWLGLAGVVWLAVLAVAATAWLWCAFSIWLGADRFVIAALMAVAITSSTIHWHARPHVFSWPLLIAWVWLMEKMSERISLLRLSGIFAFMLVWTNLHGSFFLAFLITAAYIFEFWFVDRRKVIPALMEAAAAFAATFCNPYGWHLHRHLVKYLANSELLRQISEYTSPDFHGGGGLYLMALFVFALMGAALCLQQRKVARTLVVLLFVLTALRSARGIPLVAYVALPMVSAAVTTALAGVGRLKAILEESGNFARIERQCHSAALLILAVAATAGWFALPKTRAAAGFSEKRFPVQAAGAVARLDSSARIFSPDYYGGYLIYHFRGARKVFFDGRSDFYGLQFLNVYADVMLLKPGWRPKFQKLGVTHALLPEDHPLREMLECSGWRRLHGDKTAVLLERPAAPPASSVCAMP
jgi:hypothetical protein